MTDGYGDVLADRRLVGAAHALAIVEAIGPEPDGGDTLAHAVAVVVAAVVGGALAPPRGFSRDESLAVAGLICDSWAHDGRTRSLSAALTACALNRRGRALAGALVAAARAAQVPAVAARASSQLAGQLVEPLGDQLMPTLERRLNALAGWAALAGGERSLHRMLANGGNDRAVAVVCLAVLGPDRPVVGSGAGADARRMLRLIDDGRLAEVLAESELRLDGP